MPVTAVVIGVGRFAGLEEDVRVLRAAPEHGTIGIEPSQAVFGDPLVVDQRRHVGFGGQVDRVDLVRRPEAVEEVEERHPRLECGRVRDGREVGRFLHRP